MPAGPYPRSVADDFVLSQPEASTGLRVEDANGGLSFDLRELLGVLEVPDDAFWHVQWVSGHGPDGVDHPWPDSWNAPVAVDGATLTRQAADVAQVTNGRFTAFRDAEELVMLEAVDSTFWLVWTDDEAMRARVRRAFGRVTVVQPPTEFHQYGQPSAG